VNADVPICRRDGAAVVSSWEVVLPVKPWAAAKSRLASDPTVRADLARAFTLDVIAAARWCPGVAGVLVVSREPALPALLGSTAPLVEPARQDKSTPLPADVVVVDDPASTLNHSIRYGADRATMRWPGRGVAVVTSDLPALASVDLAAVLTAAIRHPRAAVADTEGTGTTVLTARPEARLRPAFGADSFARHRRLGAVDLTAIAAPGVRRDVDVAAHLVTARRLGVGVHTRAVRGQPSSGGKPLVTRRLLG
jgi:2-phospho-L-lactate guanylyltransferase